MSKRDYLNIPYDEHIVPFPNFGSVILQHAREFPDKTAFFTPDHAISYLQLLQYCISSELKVDQHDLLTLFAKLYKGIPFKLNFKDPLDIRMNISINKFDNIDYFNPPYVRLDDQALILNEKYDFTQYNILVAAQAVGKAFKLFREGAAYCPAEIKSAADLVFGVLGPLYFGKSIYFTKNNEPNVFQYAWNANIDSNLRDVAMVSDRDDLENTYRLKKSYDKALGLGKMISPGGDEVSFLGFEIKSGNLKGHCLGHEITS